MTEPPGLVDEFMREHGAPQAVRGGIRYDVPSAVDHPAHYGGADNPYEAIRVIRAWGLGFSLGNAVKYISRAGRKDPAKLIEDLEKARWYLDEEITTLKSTDPPVQSR